MNFFKTQIQKPVLFFAGIIFVFFGFNVFSQSSQTVRGSVIDRDSKLPLIGAKVVILTTDPLLGCTSDLEGNFRIENVPVGRHTFRVSYTGYEELVLNEILVGAGKEVTLTIELTESLKSLGEVEVKANPEKGEPINEMAGPGARSFTIDEASRFSGSFNGDISRAAQSYAGVTGGGISNDMVIRGNSSKGFLWRLEGVEVPNLNHLASSGSSGGGMSILSINVIRNSDFFTGAFPAEYGNAMSGVFDVKLRTGNEEKREFSFQAGFIGLEANTEGPIFKKSKSSYLINYRYSTTGVFEKIGLDVAGNTLPLFHDLTYKFNFPTKKAGVFTIYGIGGLSQVSVAAKKDSLLWIHQDDRYEQISISNMGAAGFNHKIFIGKKAYLNSYIAITASELGADLDSLDNNYNFQPVQRSSFIESAFRVSSMLNIKFNAKNTLRSGIIYSRVGYNLQSEDLAKNIVYLASDGATDLFQGYTQWKHRFTEEITLNTGFHFTWFGLNPEPIFDPRISFSWNMAPRHTMSIGAGKHNRIEPLTFYFAEIQQTDGSFTTPNQNLKPAKALHAIVGYDFQITEFVRFRVEAYYQYLYDIPVENDSASGYSVLNYSVSFFSSIDNNASVPFINAGTGTNYGLEFTLERFLEKNYYYLFTASLYESKYVALDGLERNSRYNNNFICNAIAGKEFPVGKSKTNAIITDLKLVWSGGTPLTPIDLDASIAAGTTVFDLDQRYADQAPDFFRLDFKLGYRRYGAKSTHYFFLDIQNITNQQNVFTQYYDAEEQKIQTIYQLGFIPIFNYRVQF
jgi:hypothetical protein